jgi:hypothetical protein
MLQNVARTGPVTAYDRHQLALYAALLDADDAGQTWQEAAVTLMRINLADAGAEACWRSHLERARWIISDGLASALSSFGTPPDQIKEPQV